MFTLKLQAFVRIPILLSNFFFLFMILDQVKTLYRKAKVDPAEATRLTFDIIVDMKSICNKFQYLVHVLQEAG